MIYSLKILEREVQKLKKELERIEKVMKHNDFIKVEVVNSSAIRELESRIFDLQLGIRHLEKEL